MGPLWRASPLLLVLWGGARADSHQERIGVAAGLRAETVTAVYQDRAGFLWVRTREGLMLFDGHALRLFEHAADDPGSLSDNTIRTIYEDREGNLWLGTNTGGLNRLDRSTWRFEAFRHDAADPRSLSHDSVYAILQDRRGTLWVGTQRGLNRFDPRARTFERLMADPSDPLRPGHDYIHALIEDRQGVLWVATVGGGLEARDPATGRFTRLRHDPQDPASIGSDAVFALVEDPAGTLWAGGQAGVGRLARDRQRFIRIAAPQSAIVTSLALGPPGSLYVGTWGQGVSELDSRQGEFRGPRDLAPAPAEPSGVRIACLHTGRDGAMWVGTWGAGLQRIRPAGAPGFEVERGGPAPGVTFLDTTSVLEARDGALWVGTWGSGLVRRDRGARDFRSVHQGDGSVLALAEAPDGAVWFGTPTGLHRVDPRTGRVTRWHHAPEDPRGLGPGYVTSILSGSSGLWVGTGEGGLHRLRPDGHSFDRWRHDPADPASLSDDYITALLEDGPTLWVGTRSGGLNACKLDLSRCERHVPDASSARSLGHHFVTGILRDAGGRLWVGTGGGGLGRLDPAATGADAGFRRITQRDGLADDNVMGLVEDDDGSLWIATRDGLTRFAPRSGSVVTYGIGDGLPALEFNPRAAATGRGSLLFGTPRGLLIAQRGTPFPDHEPSPTVITAVDTLAGPAGDAPPWSLAALTLRYGDLLSLQFAVLDYGEVGRHRYAYRLAGLRDGWTDLGPRREVTFADLPPGATSCRSAAVTPAAWRVRQRSR